MTKYAIMKKAYDRYVAVRRDPDSTTKDRHEARADFREAALDLFPHLGTRAEGAGKDLIDYFAERYSSRKEK